MFHAAMSYLVLARKYRPQTFEQVIGQEHVTRTLQNAIERGRIHHAFLFCGGRGTGKTTTARILAKALSCVNAPTPQPCNSCPACVEITQGSSVDVQEIDAASQNRVEDIRDLREAIRYAPVRGKKKLYILDEVHMLSTSAFNALLKTLEEPPPHAVFVFATTDPHKLPQTILSRVQRYDFKLVPTSRLVDHLADVLGREGLPFERSALQLVAREGAGSVRDSLSLLDQVLASAQGTLTEAQAAAVLGVADRGLILGLGRAILRRDAGEAVQLVGHAYERGFDLVQLARTLLGHLRDLVVVSVVKEPLPLLDVTAGELDELQAQAALAKGRVELLFDRMVRVAEDTSRAALTRYVLEVGLVELCSVEPLQPVGELIDRLEQLEERLTGKGPQGGGRSGASSPGAGGGRPGATGGPAHGAAPAGPAPAARTMAAPPPLGSAISSVASPVASPAISPAAPAVAMAAPAARAAESGPAVAMGGPRGLASAADGGLASRGPAAGAGAAAVAARILPDAEALSVIEHAAPVAAVVQAPPYRPEPAAAAESIRAAVGANGSAAAAAHADASPAQLASADKPAGAAPAAAASAVAAAPSAPRPGSAAEPIADSAFKKATDRITEEAKSLSFLAHARPLSFEHNRVVLGHTDFALHLAQAKAADIQSRYAAEFGRPVQIEHKLDAQQMEAGSRRSLVEDKEQAMQAERARRRREAIEHPARSLVREVFGDVSFLEPTLEPEVNLHG